MIFGWSNDIVWNKVESQIPTSKSTEIIRLMRKLEVEIAFDKKVLRIAIWSIRVLDTSSQWQLLGSIESEHQRNMMYMEWYFGAYKTERFEMNTLLHYQYIGLCRTLSSTFHKVNSSSSRIIMNKINKVLQPNFRCNMIQTPKNEMD